MDIRNIAIIAHVDHGKTTLVDAMLKQSGIFRENQQVAERIMDSNDLEKERGITILAKNTSVRYGNTKINIVDTPGHSDFGGEVERVLKMVDGVLLLVDAFEGPMPQTRFVLRKALEMGLQPVVVINKIDRPDERTMDVLDEILELFMELEVSDALLDFPVIYSSAKAGTATEELETPGKSLKPLFDSIIKFVPPPRANADGPLQMLVNNTSYDQYLGRMALGKIYRGSMNTGQPISLIRHDGSITPGKLGRLYVFEGLDRLEVPEASAGEIVTFSGLVDVNIGETVASPECPEQLPPILVDEPTLKMTFMVNDSPFAGREGTHVTSRELRARLAKEMENNVSLRVNETTNSDAFQVCGRGELHLSILIETMRREGYEMQVSKPEVIYKKENGILLEPMEHLIVDIPENYMGPVMEMTGSRKGELKSMSPMGGGQTRLEFNIPARGLIGFRSEMLTETKGNAVMNHIFAGYEPFKGEMRSRNRGVLIAFEGGDTSLYGLHAAQERGTLFVEPGIAVYEGMVVGENCRDGDIEVNVCKKKHLTNFRSSTAEAAMRLEEPRRLSLEECLEYLGDDELLEVTPKDYRMRKKTLNKGLRQRESKQSKTD